MAGSQWNFGQGILAALSIEWRYQSPEGLMLSGHGEGKHHEGMAVYENARAVGSQRY